MPTGPEDGSATYNDGKVGIAYIQEYRFARYVERLQKQIQEDLDREFKLFLKHRGVEIDSGDFDIVFNPPMNFSSYRDLQLDAERANLFTTMQAVPYLANQFKLKKYLGLTEQEVKQNEEMWREENKYEKFADDKTPADLRNIGIRPEPDAAVNPDAEIPMDQVPLEDPLADPLNTDAGTVPQGGTPPGSPPESI